MYQRNSNKLVIDTTTFLPASGKIWIFFAKERGIALFSLRAAKLMYNSRFFVEFNRIRAENTKEIKLSFRSQLTCLSPSEMISTVAVYDKGYVPLSTVKPQLCTGTEREANQNRVTLQLNRGGK